MTSKAKEYRKLLKQQKAINAARGDTFKELAAMTTADHEIAGDNHLRAGNLTMAFVKYDKALQMDPTLKRVRYKKGRLLLQKGLTDDAIREFQRIVQDDPDDALAYEGLGHAYFLTEELDLSKQNFQKSLALNDQLWLSHNFLGMIYDKERKFDQAITHYKKALAINSKEVSIYNNLGLSYYQKGNYAYATVFFKKSIKKIDTKKTDNMKIAKVYNNLGISFAKLGNYTMALKAFTNGSDHSRAHNNLGVIYLSEGKYKEAIASFEKAIELNPVYYVRANENLVKARQLLYKSPRTRQGAQTPPKYSTTTSRGFREHH
jgi:tetratricopeptide (TPR) repeat protein